MKFAQIKPRYRYVASQPVPPCTEAVKIGDGANRYKDTYTLPWGWAEYFRSLNSVDSWRFISVPRAGVFNPEPDDDWYKHHKEPKIDTVSFGGNVVSVLDVGPKWTRIETTDINTDIPNPDINYITTPWLVHKFTSVNSAGRLFKASNGKDVFCPLLTRQTSYIETEELEFFPTPMFVRLTIGVEKRDIPSDNGNRLAYLPAGRVIRAVEWLPQGDQVWVRPISGGWVKVRDGTTFYSNWHMGSQTPPK